MFSRQGVYMATMTSGGDSCSVHLQNAFTRVYVQCPTMSTAADREVYGSVDGSTYFEAVYPITSGVTSPGTIVIGSGVTGKITEIPFIAPYIKLVASAVVSGGGTYKFICV